MGLFGPHKIEKLKRKRNIEKLIKTLFSEGSGYNKIRKEAANALIEIKDQRAILPILLEIKKEGTTYLNRYHLDQILENYDEIKDPEAVTILIDIIRELNINDWRQEKELLGLLYKIKDDDALKPIIQALDDENAYIRTTAVKVLGDIRSNKYVIPLIKSLNDKNSKVRINAIKALGIIKDNRAIDPMKKLKNDKVPNVRIEALIALDIFGIEPNNNAEKVIVYLRNQEWDNLKNFGSVVIDYLGKAIKSSKINERINAIKALGKIGGDEAVHLLAISLKDKDANVKKSVIHALNKMGTPKALEVVAKYKKKFVEGNPWGIRLGMGYDEVNEILIKAGIYRISCGTDITDAFSAAEQAFRTAGYDYPLWENRYKGITISTTFNNGKLIEFSSHKK